MNREQMIAWLTLEGWDVMQVGGAYWLRDRSASEYMLWNGGRCHFAADSPIARVDAVDWWLVTSDELRRLYRRASGEVE